MNLFILITSFLRSYFGFNPKVGQIWEIAASDLIKFKVEILNYDGMRVFYSTLGYPKQDRNGRDIHSFKYLYCRSK